MQYDRNIDEIIVNELSLNESISYLELKDRVIQSRRKTMSFETFNLHLKKLLNENILQKDDRGRGKLVFYSLTQDAIKQRQLNILGVNPKQLLFRRIYEKLFFYEVYHTPLNVASGGDDLDKLLEELQLNKNDLHEYNYSTSELEYAMKKEQLTFADTKTIYSVPTSDVRITKTEYWEANKTKKNKYATEFTFTLPGASIDEFIRNDSLGVKFNREDVEEAFMLLKQSGLIKPGIVFRNQTRFIIADKRLHDLILDLRKVQNEESRLLLFIWEHLREPTKEEKERMNWLMGEGEMDRILKRAEMSRYTNNKLIKGTDKDRSKYKKDLKKTLRDYDLDFYGEVYNVMTKHAHTIQEYGFLHPIIRIVCPIVLDSKYP